MAIKHIFRSLKKILSNVALGLLIALIAVTAYVLLPPFSFDEPDYEGVGFGDSWLDRSPLDVEKYVIEGGNFHQFYKTIYDHPVDPSVDHVIICGGILCFTDYHMSIRESRKFQQRIACIARKRFPNAKIVVIDPEDMLETLGQYSADRYHITDKGYTHLFAEYPLLEHYL
jgi:hypothetical protein